MNLTKSSRCTIARKSRWINASAAMMGISFFLRCGYYFGLTNLNDVPAFEAFACLWIPLLLSAAFILLLKVIRLELAAPVTGAVVALIAINYLFCAKMSAVGVISAVLLLAYGALLLGTCLGFIPRRAIVMLAAVILAAFRLLFVDLFDYVLPISQFQLLDWIPECANLFAVLAVSYLSPALRVHPLQTNE